MQRSRLELARAFLVGAGVTGLAWFVYQSLLQQNQSPQQPDYTPIPPLTSTPTFISPTETLEPVVTTATPLPSATPTSRPTVEATQSNSGQVELSEIDWPTTAEGFIKAIQVPEDKIPDKMKNDPYYRPLDVKMVTQELDNNGNWTGGWQIFFERNAGDNDKFPFTVIRNSGTTMQYGYLHDPKLRTQVGFTAQEVDILGIGEDHIGAGIPVTGDQPIAIEGLTFYPPVNTIDGSNNKHSLLQLGTDMQTLIERLNRFNGNSSGSTLQHDNSVVFYPSYPSGTVLYTFDPKQAQRGNSAVHLGGGGPAKITKPTNLPRAAQKYQYNPFKGVRRA